MKRILLLSALLLAGCAGNTVQDIETKLGGAEALAIPYVRQTPCSPISGPICSKYSTVQTIEDIRKGSRIAVDAARKAQTEADAKDSLAIAQTAVDALTNIVNSDAVQNVLKGK